MSIVRRSALHFTSLPTPARPPRRAGVDALPPRLLCCALTPPVHATRLAGLIRRLVKRDTQLSMTRVQEEYAAWRAGGGTLRRGSG